jgi:glutathione S-transferase
MGLIYHIASAADWTQAQEIGEYTTSTKGVTLEQQGFIHAGTADQVGPVAAFYVDEPDLVLLVINVDKVGPEIRYDDVPGHPRPYPHIYGPLNVDAVEAALPFDPRDPERFRQA